MSGEDEGETVGAPSATGAVTGPPAQFWLGPSYAVLRALVGERIPNGALGPASVSTKAFAVPIEVATELLVLHNKQCPRLRCAHIPPQLWQYRSWRPEAIRGEGDQVHKTLWTNSEHTFIRDVRDVILKSFPDVVAAANNHSLFSKNGLADTLSKLGKEGARQVAGVLWALGLEESAREQLFRLLLPLAGNSEPGPEKSRATGANKAQKKDLERRLREAEHRVKLADQKISKLEDELLKKSKILTRNQDELEKLRRDYSRASNDTSNLQRQLKDTEINLELAEKDAGRASTANATARQDLRESREALNELEVKRSDLARQLAFEKRYLENFKSQHKTGPVAMWEFLQKEQERIDIDRTIMSGGDRQRADDEWSANRKLRDAFLNAYPDFMQRQAPQPKRLPRAPLRFKALGGAGEVGRSCYLLEIGKRRLVVDCGIKPGSDDDLHPALDRLDRIDALLVTHAHTDHIGWIPALVSKFGDFGIYCSAPTASLLPIMLDDCRRHYLRKIEASRDRARFVRNAEVLTEEYGDEHVAQVPNLVTECEFNKQIPLTFDGISIRFYHAGHILGAASILVEDQSGRRVFFSGDFSSFPQLTLPAADWPTDLGEVDLLVMESTYGSRSRSPQEQSREELVSLIRGTIEERGGTVILPAFALGRAQELLSLICAARRDQELPISVPVYVDGMITKINPVYGSLAPAFDTKGFVEVDGRAHRREVIFEAQQRPAIIVTTSGMFVGGPVVEYAQALLPDARHRIVFSGYQDEGAASRQLMDLEKLGGGKRAVTVTDENGDVVSIEAAVPARHVLGLSAHADQTGLMNYSDRMQPRTIALVHGDLEAQRTLRSLLESHHPEAEIVCAPDEGFEVP